MGAAYEICRFHLAVIRRSAFRYSLRRVGPSRIVGTGVPAPESRSDSCVSRGQPSPGDQELQHRADRFVAGHGRGIQDQVGVARLLVRVGHPGETLDQACAGLGVQALAVAGRAYLDGRRDVDQQEVADLGDQLPGRRAGLRVGRYRRADGDAAVPRDLGRDVPDARDVEVTIGAGEGQPGRQKLPDVVAVQQRDGAVPPLDQRLRQAAGDGGLTRTRQAREEDDQAALGPGRAGPPQLTGHALRREPAGHLGPGIEQRAELGVGQLVALGAGLDQGERPPYLRARIVGPFAGADDRNRHAGQDQRAVLRPGGLAGRLQHPGVSTSRCVAP